MSCLLNLLKTSFEQRSKRDCQFITPFYTTLWYCEQVSTLHQGVNNSSQGPVIQLNSSALSTDTIQLELTPLNSVTFTQPLSSDMSPDLINMYINNFLPLEAHNQYFTLRLANLVYFFTVNLHNGCLSNLQSLH